MNLKLKRSALAGVLFLLSAGSASAQDCLPPQGKLSLMQAVDQALCANSTLHAFQRDALAADSEAQRAGAAYLPTVAATVGASIPLSGSGSANQYGLTVNWLLLDFGERSGRAAAAKASAVASNAMAANQAQDLALQVAQAYLQLHAAQASVVSAEAQVGAAEQALKLANARHAAGESARLEVLQAQSAMAQARVFQTKATTSTRVQRAALAALLGVPAQDWRSIEITGVSSFGEIAAPSTESLAELVSRAKATREDLLAARARVEALRAQTQAARSAYFPTAALAASLSRINAGSGPSISSRTVGVVVNIPIYSGGATDAQVSSLVAQTDAQSERVAAAENKVAFDVVSAFETLNSSGEQLQAAQTLQDSATAAREQAQARYEAGVGTTLELFDALAKKALADETLISAQLDFHLSRAQLARSLGLMPVQ